MITGAVHQMSRMVKILGRGVHDTRSRPPSGRRLYPSLCHVEGKRSGFCACTRFCTTWRVSGRASSGHAHPAQRRSELPGGQVAQGAVGTLSIVELMSRLGTSKHRRPAAGDASGPDTAQLPQASRCGALLCGGRSDRWSMGSSRLTRLVGFLDRLSRSAVWR